MNNQYSSSNSEYLPVSNNNHNNPLPSSNDGNLQSRLNSYSRSLSGAIQSLRTYLQDTLDLNTTQIQNQVQEMAHQVLKSARSWKKLLNVKRMSVPASLQMLVERVKLNFKYFAPNYALVLVGATALSFLGQIFYFLVPVMLITFATLYPRRRGYAPSPVDGPVDGPVEGDDHDERPPTEVSSGLSSSLLSMLGQLRVDRETIRLAAFVVGTFLLVTGIGSAIVTPVISAGGMIVTHAAVKEPCGEGPEEGGVGEEGEEHEMMMDDDRVVVAIEEGRRTDHHHHDDRDDDETGDQQQGSVHTGTGTPYQVRQGGMTRTEVVD